MQSGPPSGARDPHQITRGFRADPETASFRVTPGQAEVGGPLSGSHRAEGCWDSTPLPPGPLRPPGKHPRAQACGTAVCSLKRTDRFEVSPPMAFLNLFVLLRTDEEHAQRAAVQSTQLWPGLGCCWRKRAPHTPFPRSQFTLRMRVCGTSCCHAIRSALPTHRPLSHGLTHYCPLLVLCARRPAA